MNPIDYHCKICGKPGVAYYDPDCPIGDLELHRAALCCDRCYNFRDTYMTHKRAAIKVCTDLIAARTTGSQAVQQQANQKVREVLYKLTKRIAALTCDHYRIQNVWEEDFVRDLMAKPENVSQLINAYHQGIMKLSRQP